MKRMSTGEKGLNLIKEFEGLELRAYLCSAGVLTIGYGHTSAAGDPPVTYDMRITQQTAEKILARDLRIFERAVNKLVQVPLNQNQFDALVSFTYNLGEANLARSTLLKKLNKGDYDAVPYELALWNKAKGKPLKGLTRRRAAEALLWSTPVEEDENPIYDRVQPERDVPSIVNSENIAAASAGVSALSVHDMDASSPITWVVAAILAVSAGVFLYLFLQRRGK